MVTSRPTGLSTWEADLFDHLMEHVQSEAELLDAYRRLGDESGSPWVRYVSRLIEEDETRHHRFFAELLNALRAIGDGESGEAVPTVSKDVANPTELLRKTDELLAAERHDAQGLKRLARSLRPMRGLSLWPLLVELMQRDTEKHIGVLQFLKVHLKEQINLERRRARHA